MNPRGKRLAFTVAATGLSVLLVLGIVHRDAVRDHVEAWRFQLTRETGTIDPSAGVIAIRGMEAHSGPALVFDPAELEAWPPFPAGAIVDTADLVVILGASGWRVLEQRFLHRAYVVMRDPEAIPGEDGPIAETFLVPFSTQEATPAE